MPFPSWEYCREALEEHLRVQPWYRGTDPFVPVDQISSDMTIFGRVVEEEPFEPTADDLSMEALEELLPMGEQWVVEVFTEAQMSEAGRLLVAPSLPMFVRQFLADGTYSYDSTHFDFFRHRATHEQCRISREIVEALTIH